MVNAYRARGFEGNRAPSAVDSRAVPGPLFLFDNLASLNFGGTDEFVTGLSLDSIGTFTNQITVAAWAKGNVNPASRHGIVNATSDGNLQNNGWGLQWNSSTTVRFFVNSFNASASSNISPAVTAQDWNFFVGVYDGTLGGFPNAPVKAYANAELAVTNTSSTSATITSGTNLIEMGSPGNTNGPTNRFFNGKIDEFAIWDIPLSSVAITALYNNGVPVRLNIPRTDYVQADVDALKLWWRCGDGTDSNTAGGIQDSSGGSNNGTMTNMEDADINEDIPS